MKKMAGADGFFSHALHGSQVYDIHEFKEDTIWADKAFHLFFKNATVDTHVEKVNYQKEITARLFALILLILFSPIFLFVIIGIKLTMPGKVFFKQLRVGKNNKLFHVYKFRSMIENAEKETGHTLSWNGDPRVTKFGQFLRKSHFDELPQLINVLMGDMYFIGPRPERPEFTQVYDNEIIGYSKRHSVKPGITGLAQIACVYDATAATKLKFDMMYIASRDSLILNFLIAFHTAKKMLFMSSTANILK
jgi:lipopolysaccharide/colanic/teichoic acid biosynthesis glycosyltransferase